MTIRVLIADDHSVVRQGLRMFLGLDPELEVVGEATSGDEAVHMARQLRPDVVLMDLLMPGMDGIAATKAIRRLGERVRDIPIIALTANAMAEQVAHCRSAGMNDHLAKPIDREALLALIAKWSGNESAHRAHAPAECPEVAFDERVLKELEASLGRPKVLELIASFRKQLEAAMGVVASTVDRERLAWEAHALASCSGGLGCNELLTCSRALMAALKEGQRDVAPLVADISAAATRALVAMDTRYAA